MDDNNVVTVCNNSGNGSGTVNGNQEDLNMSFDEGHQEVSSQSEMEAEGPSNFLEENLKSVHENFEILNTILHESNEEIPVIEEIVFNNCQEMMDIKMDLNSKYAEMGNLAGDLHILYNEPEQQLMRMQSTEGDSDSTLEISSISGP